MEIETEIEASYEEKPFIKINNLIKNYDDGGIIKALNGTDLEINRENFISIIDPSGSGKLTLLNMLEALDNPNSGTIDISGINLTKDGDLSEFRS